MFSKEKIKSAMESLLFVWGEPLDIKIAADVFNLHWKDAYEYMLELQEEYQQQQRGIYIQETDKSFQFCTRPENHVFIERLCSPAREKKLSQSALEVLAIIAYKQPVTKGEIEGIRGVKCDRVLEGLGKKELICEAGRSTTIGRPILYGTTKKFLNYFGFTSISQLPPIEDIASLVEDEEQEQRDPQQISIEL